MTAMTWGQCNVRGNAYNRGNIMEGKRKDNIIYLVSAVLALFLFMLVGEMSYVDCMDRGIDC